MFSSVVITIHKLKYKKLMQSYHDINERCDIQNVFQTFFGRSIVIIIHTASIRCTIDVGRNNFLCNYTYVYCLALATGNVPLIARMFHALVFDTNDSFEN